MLLNSLVRIATAVSLLIIGYLSELYSANIINIVGLIIGFILIFFTLLLKSKNSVFSD